MTEPRSDAERLERLWSGEFGDEYVDRNAGSYEQRRTFWFDLLRPLECSRVLEVGCNVGGNLTWIADALGPTEIVGVDVNRKALAHLRRQRPDIGSIWAQARELPFRDGWFDLVLTMGVLIHQPEESLEEVMGEVVRTSRRWVLCGEYYASETEGVPYRGHEGALFRRDYGGLYQRQFPELTLHSQGHLAREDGWDDVTWWLFEKGRQ